MSIEASVEIGTDNVVDGMSSGEAGESSSR